MSRVSRVADRQAFSEKRSPHEHLAGVPTVLDMWSKVARPKSTQCDGVVPCVLNILNTDLVDAHVCYFFDIGLIHKLWEGLIYINIPKMRLSMSPADDSEVQDDRRGTEHSPLGVWRSRRWWDHRLLKIHSYQVFFISVILMCGSDWSDWTWPNSLLIFSYRQSMSPDDLETFGQAEVQIKRREQQSIELQVRAVFHNQESVSSNTASWEIPELNGGLQPGKSSVNLEYFQLLWLITRG